MILIYTTVAIISPLYLSLCYYFGAFYTFRASKIQMTDTVVIHIPTVAIGSLQTISILSAKYFFFAMRQNSDNTLVLIKATCYYVFDTTHASKLKSSNGGGDGAQQQQLQDVNQVAVSGNGDHPIQELMTGSDNPRYSGAQDEG
jgi:hypothetical protein